MWLTLRGSQDNPGHEGAVQEPWVPRKSGSPAVKGRRPSRMEWGACGTVAPPAWVGHQPGTRPGPGTAEPIGAAREQPGRRGVCRHGLAGHMASVRCPWEGVHGLATSLRPLRDRTFRAWP